MGEIRKHLSRDKIGLLCEFYANGLSATQISRILNVPSGTVHGVIQRHYKPKHKIPMILVLDSKV